MLITFVNNIQKYDGMLALLVVYVNVYSKQFTVDSLQLTTTERLQKWLALTLISYAFGFF